MGTDNIEKTEIFKHLGLVASTRGSCKKDVNTRVSEKDTSGIKWTEWSLAKGWIYFAEPIDTTSPSWYSWAEEGYVKRSR